MSQEVEITEGSNNLEYGTGGIKGTSSVGPGTGTMNYSIPLFEITSNGVALPITLSYNGGGVRVNGKEAEYGTNWSLNLPGRIDRMVNGLPDELRHTYCPEPPCELSEINSAYGYLGEFYDLLPPYIQNYMTTDYSADVVSGTNSVPETPENLVDKIRKLASGAFDTKPDYFKLDAPIVNGMFTSKRISALEHTSSETTAAEFIDLTGQLAKIKASTHNWRLSAFSINDFNGNKLAFSQNEESGYSDLFDINDVTFNSSWLLTRIDNAHGQEAFEFQYASNSYEVEMKNDFVSATRSHYFPDYYSFPMPSVMII